MQALGALGQTAPFPEAAAPPALLLLEARRQKAASFSLALQNASAAFRADVDLAQLVFHKLKMPLLLRDELKDMFDDPFACWFRTVWETRRYVQKFGATQAALEAEFAARKPVWRAKQAEVRQAEAQAKKAEAQAKQRAAQAKRVKAQARKAEGGPLKATCACGNTPSPTCIMHCCKTCCARALPADTVCPRHS